MDFISRDPDIEITRAATIPDISVFLDMLRDLPYAVGVEVLHAKSTEIDDTADLHITTYGIALRLESLRNRKWDIVILDEAQAIKNPAAGQTKAIKQLNAAFRIAMTGTPIENRLSDLWSLFDFLNAGLLGSAKEFSGYTKKVKDSGSYPKLRNVISPSY